MENNNIVFPNYDHCILNTITSILKHYNVPTNHKSLNVLDNIINSKQYENIVFIILDGMGEHILNNISPNGFFNNNKVDCLTSVFPSTTTAALTTYYSGKPPFETGWIAWSQYFKEYGRAVDMLKHSESYKNDSLSGAKINVFESVVNYTPVYEQIENASGIKAYDISPSYSDKRSKRTLTADNIDELIDNIELLCKINEPKYIFAYSDEPDHSLHKFGTDSDEVKELLLSFENKIKNMINNLPDNTLVLISADHGHRNIEKPYSTLDFPELLECMYMPASLESRTITFFIKDDMRQVFEERFKKIFNDEFILFTKEEFLNKNLLGFGNKHYKIDDFLGNYIAVSTGGSMIRLETFLADGKPVKKSTHCGLSKEEMEVPLIVAKR